MIERMQRTLWIALAFLSLLPLALSSAQAQSIPALGSGAACWWGRITAPPPKTKGCVSTDPTSAADCWMAIQVAANSNLITGGTTCKTYPNNTPTVPYYCGSGGMVPTDYKCGATYPMGCQSVDPQLLDPADVTCATACSTGYLDGNGNCTAPPPKKKKKERANPYHKKCDKCNSTVTDDADMTRGATTGYGMSVADIYAMDISVGITDVPVGYQPSIGPAAFVRLSYNQKDDGQPATFSYSNLGPKWTLSTMSFVSDDPANPGKTLLRYVAGGGAIDYTDSNLLYTSGTGAFTTERESRATLYRIPATGTVTSYELRFPSGAKHVYGLLDGSSGVGRRVFLTQIVDPQGNVLTLNYDGTFRLTAMTDATGRSTTFSYTNGDPLKVTRITDPFGRHADFTYDGSGNLASITDVIGITSSFGYSTAYSGYVSSMTTPYGTTGFNYYETSPNIVDPMALNYQSLEQTDPLGNIKRAVFRDQSSLAATPTPTPTGVTVAGDYSINNSFVWDEHQYPLAITKDGSGNVTAEDTSKARLTHWLKNPMGLVAATPAATKAPLENYVYYNYTGQPSAAATGSFALPTAAGRVLDGGATYSVDKATYNALGNPLTITDALGRVINIAYAANNIDVLTVKQGTNLLATYAGYNSQHLPQTYTDAAGKVWSTAYNAAGQVIYKTDPLNETRFWEYDGYGRVTRITIPTSIAFASVVYGTTNTSVPTAASFTYDGYDRVRTKTDSEGYVLTYDYDALDRVTRITYPDGTHDDRDYTFLSGPNAGNPSLDLRKATDRLGRITTYAYDADRRLTSVTEPTDVSNTRTTSYSYYENGTLKDQTDANGNVTHFDIDIQSRPTAKTYAYGTAGAKTETSTYETTTSRLKTLTDALAQVKTYSYAVDNRITAIAYTNSVNSTPNVGFTWDGTYPRLGTMADTTGTTTYSYVAIGTNGALQVASIDNGSYGNDTITNTYDALGRLSTRTINGGNEAFTYDILSRIATHTTGLGTFTYGYLGQTQQVTSRSITVGSITTSSAWAYDTNANDRRLTTITNSGVTRSYGLSYLIPGGGGASNPYDIQGITDTAAATHPWATQTHGYTYDYADRLLTATQTTPGNNAYAYDKLDNATTITNPGSSTVNPTYNGNNQLATYGANTYAYDANGNTLSGDGTKTYKWDAENRLIEIDYVGGTNKTVFTYDALNRRTTQAETVSGTTTTTRYLWCGLNICQSRTSADVTIARYHTEGEYIVSGTKKYVYMPDQLGSVRDVIDATTGNLVGSLDYGPYGKQTRINGMVTPFYQYAGLIYHPNSTLSFATFRAFDGATGRWLNRDPVREWGGINLYGYVGSNPMTRRDSIGLDWSTSMRMTWQWVTGTGPDLQFYGPGTSPAEEMRHAPGVEAARKLFKEKNADIKACTGGEPQSLTNFAAKFGLKGLWEAGLNPTQQFIGSYRVDIISWPTNMALWPGETTVVISNTSSFRSFGYGIAPDWNRSTFGPGGNMSQIISWPE